MRGMDTGMIWSGLSEPVTEDVENGKTTELRFPLFRPAVEARNENSYSSSPKNLLLMGAGLHRMEIR